MMYAVFMSDDRGPSSIDTVVVAETPDLLLAKCKAILHDDIEGMLRDEEHEHKKRGDELSQEDRNFFLEKLDKLAGCATLEDLNKFIWSHEESTLCFGTAQVAR